MLLFFLFAVIMFSAGAKIIKPDNQRPDEFETSISQAILELESSSDLKSHLRELYITAARVNHFFV